MLDTYKNIKLLRKKNGWTQAELSTRMGYTDRSMIAKIESGKVDLSRSKIFDFARIFGVTPSDLMGDDGIQDDFYDRLIEPYNNEGELKTLLKLYDNAIPEAQKMALIILETGQIKIEEENK